MEPTLAVIGLNFRTSPVAVRERFWLSETRRVDALRQLLRSEAIDEVFILATCSRTEFLVWTSDVPTAANSVLRYLTQEFRLKLCEWSHFYRLMGDAAISHFFSFACGLDCMLPGDPCNRERLLKAWELAQEAEATGRFLDAIVQRALTVCERVQSDSTAGWDAGLLPEAVVELSKSALGELAGREAVLLGAGKMSQMAGRSLLKAGLTRLTIINRTLGAAENQAHALGSSSALWEERLAHLERTDLVVTATSSPHCLVSLQEAQSVAKERGHKPLAMIDLSVPRNIDPRIRKLDGIRLFDIDDLEQLMKRNLGGRLTAIHAAEKIVQAEAYEFSGKLMTDPALLTVVALREHLDELCQEELEALRDEFGPFTEDQDQALTTLTAHITQRISGSLARELKALPERKEQQVLTAAVGRLFHLEQRLRATANKN